MVPPDQRRLPVLHRRDALVVAGAIRLHGLTWAALRAPRPVLVGAAVAAAAALAAFVHFTGIVPGPGATGLVPHRMGPRPRGDR